MAVALSVLVIVSDLYARRVPNVGLIAALIFGAGLIVMIWMQGKGGPPWPALFGLLIGLAVLLPIHLFGWMGAGDVKFFAVLGFLLGAKALLPIWIIASVIAGIHTVAILLSRHLLSRTAPGWNIVQTWIAASPVGQHLGKTRQGRKGLPYAAWLGVGALITVFNPELMHW
ncbi:A24 family peptidase [Rhodanobacter glycinis]|uniref:A24 family peptidase n=1 Tax=Rhodanobacter glycinis TaxID=582702 RepID=UPI002481E58F|nr:prepilin peptidase [Rhodanobacter glycinis]